MNANARNGMLCAACAAAAALGGAARAGDDLAGWTWATNAMGVPPPVVTNANFEQGAAGWRLPKGFRVEPGAGRNGTGGLVFERTDASRYELASQRLDLRPGVLYRFRAWVRTENVRGDESGGTLCVEFSGGGRYIGGAFPHGLRGTRDWTAVEGTVVRPPEADQCTLSLYLRRGMTGRVWFDDVALEPEAPRWLPYLLHPPMETLDAAGGTATVASLLAGRRPDLDAADPALSVRAEFCATGAVFRTSEAPLRDGRADLAYASLPGGDLEMRLSLLHRARRTVYAQASIPVRAAGASAAPSAHAVTLDRAGRTRVGGKPFLPAGLYCGGLPSAAELDRIAAAGFNCLMPYGSMSMKCEGTKREGAEAIREALDACERRGLKVIFSIKDVYAGTRWERIRFLDAAGETDVVRRVVTSFRDHPAILAWYVNDELPVTMLDRLTARRREVNRLDPAHPAWAVLYQFDELPHYGPTCDVLGVDPYPIADASSRDMRRVVAAMDGARRAAGTREGVTVWAVPQIFNWGEARAKTREEYVARFRDPTAAEMRAMTLLCALRGARGFVFYSYSAMRHGPAAPDFERRWPDVASLGGLLRDLAPFLLSDRDAPAVGVETEKGEVEARAFRDDAGRLRVIVTAVGPGEARAVLKVGDAAGLRSLYGGCESLGGGRYRFGGKDVCADLLAGD